MQDNPNIVGSVGLSPLYCIAEWEYRAILFSDKEVLEIDFYFVGCGPIKCMSALFLQMFCIMAN